MAVRTVSLLPAVTGAWRDLGGGATLSTSGAFKLNGNALQRPEWVPPGTRTINMIRLGEALTEPDAGVGGPPVQAFIVYNSNPAVVQAIEHMRSQLEPLTAEDIAESIHFAITTPEHMSINELLVRPTKQAR